MSKFYVSVKVDKGDCIVSYNNKPTWCLDNAMLFDTMSDATNWTLSSEAKEWDSSNTFEICEIEE
jgi:hypothetical protein